jgi:hypothetical protein
MYLEERQRAISVLRKSIEAENHEIDSGDPSTAARDNLAFKQEELSLVLDGGMPGLGSITLPPLAVGAVRSLGGIDIRIDQVIDRRNMLVNIYGVNFWVVMDTSGFVDDQDVAINCRAAAIIGTKTYETAIGGTRTVFVLKPFDPFAEIKAARGE